LCFALQICFYFFSMLPNLGFLSHNLFIFYECSTQFKIAFMICFSNSDDEINLCHGKNKLQRYTKLWEDYLFLSSPWIQVLTISAWIQVLTISAWIQDLSHHFFKKLILLLMFNQSSNVILLHIQVLSHHFILFSKNIAMTKTNTSFSS
jgi:hypothetical protein